MATANEGIRDATLQRSIYLDHYATGLQQQINTLLDSTEPKVRAEIERRLSVLAGPGGYAFGHATNQQLAALTQSILDIRSGAIDQGFTKVGDELSTLAVHEADHSDTVVNQFSPVRLDTTLPSATQLAAIVTTTPFQGRLLSTWADGLAQADAQRIMDEVTVGMAQGLSTDNIIRNVLGTGALNGADGITQQTRRDAASVVQTAVATTANEARAAYVDANSDIIDSEVWVATLDGSTCEECAALDGTTYPAGEGDQPPAHFNCRCVRVPALNGEVIGTRPATSATEDQLAGLSEEDRAAKVAELTGQVPASMSYQEWLSQQSAAFQDEVLGPARGELFRTGNFPLSRFINSNGDTLTLDELKAKGPGALFVSADTTDVSLGDVLARADDATQAAVMSTNQEIVDMLGIDASQANVIGVLGDSAENSVATAVASGTDYDTLRALAAMQGEIGDQQSVLLFQSGEGDSALSQFSLRGTVEDVHQQLLDSGIDNHTLQPLANGDVQVTVFSQDQTAADALAQFGENNGISIETQLGRGEFIGSPLAGSDAPAALIRSDAINQYEAVINDYLKTAADDVQQGWQRILDDWRGTQVTLPGVKSASAEVADSVVGQWIANSPVKTVDDLFVNASQNDAWLRNVGRTVEQDTGAKWTSGPIKGLERTQEKLAQKAMPPSKITDVVRGMFTVDTPEQADAVVQALGGHLAAADENWRYLSSGYFDRTVKVLLPDGRIAEIQIGPKALFDAKFGDGHKMYETYRSMKDTTTLEAVALNNRMKALYSDAAKTLDPKTWRTVLTNVEKAVAG